jgi:hypothetical protein
MDIKNVIEILKLFNNPKRMKINSFFKNVDFFYVEGYNLNNLE